MASIPGAVEAQTKARTYRPGYVRKALSKTGELIREAAESGELAVKIDLETLLTGLDYDKHTLALAHLRMELNLRGYHLRDYEHPVIPEDGSIPHEIKRGFYVYWGWGADDD